MSFDAEFKKEIARLARKAVKQELDPLRQSIAAQRKQMAQQRESINELARQLRETRKLSVKASSASPQQARAPRFSPDLIKKRRQRLKLSQKDYGLLLGVSGLTILKYEKGSSAPKGETLMAFQSTATMSQDAALQRIDTLS